MLPPVVSALLAFVTTFFRSQASLRLENLALRHQLAVYKQTVLPGNSNLLKSLTFSFRGIILCRCFLLASVTRS